MASHNLGDPAYAKAARRDIRKRADAAGYDPARAVGRFFYGSFVSTPRRYMYVETPKAACTALKRLVTQIEGAAFRDGARPYQHETRPEMLIHQRRYIDIPTLLDVPDDVREAIFAGKPEWFIFAVTRNPFSRLVSVFENKVRMGEPDYRELTARYGDAAFLDPKAAFGAFVHEVVREPARRKDAHLTAQETLLMPRLVPYRLFKLEEIDNGLAAFGKHVAQHGGPEKLTLERMNVTIGAPWRDFYDAATARAVAEIYADDFKTFDYDPADWRGGRDRIVESEDIRRWRAEVVGRNAMIARLYDALEKPKPK